MNLVVVAFIFLMTLFTTKAHEGAFVDFRVTDGPEINKPVSILRDSNETEVQRLERLAARRAAIAAARAARGIEGSGAVFSDGGRGGQADTRTLNDQVPVVAGESGPENLSPEQIAKIKSMSDRSTMVFEHSEGEGHPLSSPELVEKELARNRERQAEIEKLSEENPGKFEKELVTLKKQEEILINSQEFLAFCKESKSEVTFTGQELERTFILLDLPSVSDIKSMTGKQLYALRGIFRTKLQQLTRMQKISGIDDLEEQARLDFEQNKFLSEDQKDILEKYLNSKVDRIKFFEDKARVDHDDGDGEKTTPEEQQAIDNMRKQILSDLTEKFERLRTLLKETTFNQEEYLMLKRSIQKINDKIPNENKDGVEGASKIVLEDLQAEKNKIAVFLDALSDVSMFKREKITSENLNSVVNLLLSSVKIGPEFQKLISSKILENLDKSELEPEQKQFVQKIIKQTEAFSNLKEQATEAIDTNDVVRMQELQDELRDCYEDVIRNNWKDQELTNIDGVFLQNIRKSINELLREFNEKARSFTGAAKGGKSFTERIKYKFKRLFVRLTFDTRKMRYRSERSLNKADFGLNLVDFKKAATDGYVATLKEKSEILANVLRKAQGSNLNETAETQALRDLKDQMKTFDFVVQEILALKGIASLGGTLPNAMVRNAFKVSELPDADSFDSTFLSNLKKSSGSRRYKDLMIGLLKMGDSHPELIKKFSEEGFLRLSKDEQEKMKEVFKTWRNKFTNESILSKSNSLISVKNLPDLRLLAEFNGASPEFMDVLRTPETAQYAVDAYKGDVVVPSGQAKSIVTQISSFIENITTAEKLLAPKKIENGSLLSLASEA